MADQYRLFPMATSSDGLICFEFDQYRRARSEFSDIYWRLYPRLVKVSDDGKKIETLKKYDSFEIEDEEYSYGLRKFLKRRISDVERIRNVKLQLELTAATFANHEKQLDGVVEFQPDTLTGSGYFVVEKKSYELFYPDRYLKKHVNIGFGYDDTVVVTDARLKADYPKNGRRYGLGCVRKYKSGDSEYMAVTLISGDWRFGIKNPLKEGDLSIMPVEEFAYHEPIVHHGHSFDLIFKIL